MQNLQIPFQQSQKNRQSQSQSSNIQDQQLTKMLRTLKKIKKIQKNKKLTSQKAKPLFNKVFGEMSYFFHQTRNQKLKLKKQMRIAQYNKKMQQKASLVNHIKKQDLRSIKNDKMKIFSILNDQPEIVQQTSNLPHEKISEQSLSNKIQVRCHICKQFYQQIHIFYGLLCPSCALLNEQKRLQTANLIGYTALVTGARIKIGYQICLKLLRDGAYVYATSRFANDTLLRYKRQSDYELWKNNLKIIQCDFLSANQVSKLISIIKQNVSSLDILINNAAQTLTRPQQFYTYQLQNQKLAIKSDNIISTQDIQLYQNNFEKQLYPSVFNSSILISPNDIDLTSFDQFGQPLDKRIKNSWVQSISQISLSDCYTTQVINSIVPFHLISQLKPLMANHSRPAWIINVSSMEGVFYKNIKQQYHPHTNMAKAALNMITRTCAKEFRVQNIFMNSVDTGWVTNQNPYHIAEKMGQKLFKCPLDCIDGAMRVLDPIYIGLNYSQFPYGKFFKDYKPSFW